MTRPAARIPLAELRNLMKPGLPLPFRVLDSMGRLLLASGQRVLGDDQLEALIDRGACVDAEEAAAVREAAALAARGAAEQPQPTWFDTWERQLWTLDAMLRALGREPAKPAGFDAFVDGFFALVDSQPDAALFSAVRQGENRFALYALTHALNTATMAVLAARMLGWQAPRVRSLALAALTMNASIVDLQAQMAEQSDPPSKRQMDLIRSHPQRSVELLRAVGVSDLEWLGAVADHHERSGGSGYPRALAQPGEAARLLRACDVFAAKISARAFRPALAPQVAARQLFQEEGGGPIAAALIKAVGVYPPGDFVKLRNGEVAVVAQRATAGKAPTVVVLLSATGKLLPSAPRRDTTLTEFAIAAPAADRSALPRILPEQVFGLLYP